MKNKLKRLMALILALSMCLSLLQTTALAAEVETSILDMEIAEAQGQETLTNEDQQDSTDDESQETLTNEDQRESTDDQGQETLTNEDQQDFADDEDNPNLDDSDIDEDASDELVLYNDATKLEDGTIQLTELATWQSGSAWYGHQIDATSGFTTTFSYWAGGGRDDSFGGADGIVLTFSEETGLGANGGSLGFVGTGAYGVELDSYPHNSNDPSDKHIAIIKDSASNHLAYVLDDRVDDSMWHTLTVAYDYELATLDVYLDNEVVLSSDDVELPKNVYLGISASTGAGKNEHLIKDFFIKGVVSVGASFEEDNIPIVIIPGIMGSKLYSDKECTEIVWGTEECVTDIDRQNGKALAIENTLYTTGLVLESSNSTEREYGTVDASKNLVDFLCDEYMDMACDADGNDINFGRDVYFFSYDWRQSNIDSAAKLYAALQDAGIYRAEFICHSMGGLVISQYINSYGSSSANHIITLGTPYQGATKLLQAVLTSNVLNFTGWGATIKTSIANYCLEKGGLSKTIKSRLVGVEELTPTLELWASNPYNKVVPGVISSRNYSEVPIDYASGYNISYGGALNYLFGASAVNTLNTTQDKISSAMETLLQMDNAYFAISGSSAASNKTITGATLLINIDDSIEDIDRVVMFDYSFGKGDGTVPFDSANMLLDYCPSRAAYFDLNHGELGGGEFNDFTKSTSAPEWEKETAWIKSIIDNATVTTQTTIPESSPYTVIRVACPVDATITLEDEYLCNSDDNYSDRASFGVMELAGTDNDIKIFCIDSNADYNVILNGTDGGTMNYTIRFFDADDNLYDERTFEDVPITADTVITTGTDENEDTILLIDDNGDGEIDSTWTASENEDVTEPDECDHTYGEPSFAWSDENRVCTATFICEKCGDQQVVDCTVTKETTVEPTANKDGEVVYTAVAEFNDQTYTDTKTVVIPATGSVDPGFNHNYGWMSWFNKWFGGNNKPSESETPDDGDTSKPDDPDDGDTSEPDDPNDRDTSEPEQPSNPSAPSKPSIWDWIKGIFGFRK